MTISNPFDLLQDLEQRTLKGLTGLPALDLGQRRMGRRWFQNRGFKADRVYV